MANKAIDKHFFDESHFSEVLKEKGLTIKELCADKNGYSAKSVSRAIHSGVASEQLIRWIAGRLDTPMGYFIKKESKRTVKIEIYLKDLTSEKQEEIKKIVGDNNWDIFPIATIELENFNDVCESRSKLDLPEIERRQIMNMLYNQYARDMGFIKEDK